MSDSSGDTVAEAGSSSPVDAGKLLRRAREASGFHIAALAVMLKVPVKKLEALEDNRFDLLPDAVFVRALAASVCRTLKIDAAPILAQLPSTKTPKLIYQGAGINEVFRSPGDAPRPSMWMNLSKRALLAGLALLLGALVLVFLNEIKAVIGEARSSLEDSVAAIVVVKPPTGSAQTVPVVDPVEWTKSVAFVDPKTSGPVIVGVTAASPDIISNSTSAPFPISAGSSTEIFPVTTNAPSATSIVVFAAKGESWVEATDAAGQVVLRRMLAAGDVVGTAGILPLKVVVGRANMTQVQIRGTIFDLDPVSKDNVARFEVK